MLLNQCNLHRQISPFRSKCKVNQNLMLRIKIQSQSKLNQLHFAKGVLD